MSSHFALRLPPRLSFGPGAAAALADEAAALGRRTLVVTGSDPRRVSEHIDALDAAGDALAVVRVTGEPTMDDARRAAETGRSIAADVVVAVGGGSVIDLGKAAAMLLGNGGDPLDYIEVIGRGRPIAAPSVPLIAVPTTAGTGAEVTANAVLSSRDHGVKASLRSSSMIPHLAIVDPVLTVDCPAPVTAASGMDAMTQCLEPFVSNRANPVTDGWCRTGLMSAGRGLRRAYADGSDLQARSAMALASTLGGLALANAKLGAVHGFAAVLGGMTAAPHGAICAAMLAPVCRANLARADPALVGRFEDIAAWLTGDRQATAADGLDWIEETRAQLRIPRLSDFGLSVDDTDEVVMKAARASSMQGNPVHLDAEDLAEVFRAAL